MTNLSTQYMGLDLRNPIIAASSGITHSLENIRELEKNGIGAVVLKSLFEEQIRYEISKSVGHNDDSAGMYSEAFDYIGNYARMHYVDEYLNLITSCKKSVTIPIIASINCVSADEWTSFARRIEEAGANALELNIFVLPADPNFSGEQNEKIYFDILEQVKKHISIPIALKISYYFSGLAKTTLKLSWAGAKGIVLFNRFYSPDINLDNLKIVPSNVFSTPDEMNHSLRWVAMLSDRLQCDIAASTGIHDGKGLVKQLLAGAKAVQIATTLYKNGFGRIGEMLQYLENWMEKHHYEKTSDFIGKLSLKKAENPAAWERVQFMKHFAGIE
ncbi:MAG: dihydroorotate dehydrogenase-like protein [Bacteroidales bacterium]|nr:dihydroorotate dehydrogenase-like protein [Bacteroidales bacterium]MDZ4204362.1 dihydroorotate dehydrogenase-like protein [Bacteroidales bacterium]